MATIVIVEPDAIFSQRLSCACGVAAAQVTVIGSLEEVAEITPAAEVVIAGPSLPTDEVLAAAESITSLGCGLVIAAAAVDAELLRAAMRAGASDVVAATDSGDEIASSVAIAREQAAKQRAAAMAEDKAPTRKGKVVTVFSTKGGVGKTVLATNLGVALARDKSKTVALVDLDLEWGDVAIMLGIKPEHTIYDAVQVFDRLDAEMLAGFMEHHPGGLMALLAPVRPEDAEGINAARVAQVIDLLSANYDYVVIDTAPSLSEVVLTALDRSDEVYVMTMMDVASIKNTRISLQKLRQLGYDPARVRIVLNRADSKVLLQPAEVEDAIGGKVVARIPSDRIVPLSVNKGVPVIIDAPKSAVARSIDALAGDAAAPVVKEA